MGSRGRGGLRLPEVFLIEPDSLSLTDLVGDLEGELLVGESGGRSVVLSLSLELVLCFFFGEVLEKMFGRTMGDDEGGGRGRTAKSFTGLRTADCKLPLSLHPTARWFVLKCFSAPDTVSAARRTRK